VLAGRWLEERAVERALRTHPNRDIRRLGFVSAEDKAALYRLAASSPSLVLRGLRLAALEAMATGRRSSPVSSARRRGRRRRRILVDPYRPAELATRSNPSSNLRLSPRTVEARQTKAQAFTWEACAAATERALSRLVSCSPTELLRPELTALGTSPERDGYLYPPLKGEVTEAISFGGGSQGRLLEIASLRSRARGCP